MIYGDWLGRRAALTPDAIALVDALHQNREITYQAFAEKTHQTCQLLLMLGVRMGDRVAILAQNRVEWLELWFACGRIGAVLQALSWRLTAGELKGLVQEAEPVLLWYGAELTPLAEALHALLVTQPVDTPGSAGERVSIPRFLSIDAPPGRGAALSDACWLGERADLPTAAPPEIALTAESPWVLCYTGGTTGLPKAAVLTHGAMTWNAVNTVVSWGLTANDKTFLNAPLFHTGGMNVLTLPLIHVGGTSIVCQSFDAGQVFDFITQRRISVFFGVPTMFIALQQHERWHSTDFSSLRWVISGGAPCPQPVFAAFFEKNVEFKTGYGLTEAGPNNFWLPAAEVRLSPGAVGYPLFHVDALLVDEAGRPANAGEVGELWLRGPHLCAGYFKRPAETEKTFVDGWLHTGDLARRDEAGRFTIVGRLKDVIISGGENLYPAEIESVLAGHPAVAEVAVIGVADARWGEVGRALVVVRPAHMLTEQELLTFARAHMARFKVPQSIRFVDSLPRTGAGKVDKKKLSEEYGISQAR